MVVHKVLRATTIQNYKLQGLSCQVLSKIFKHRVKMIDIQSYYISIEWDAFQAFLQRIRQPERFVVCLANQF